MSEDTANGLARPGDKIGKDELRATHDQLIALAALLLPDIEKASSPRQLATLMQANGDLLAQARRLIDEDIVLIAGQARVFADQLRAAIEASKEVIAKVEDVKAKLAKVGAVLDFVATVFTGSGTKIFEGAHALKDALAGP
jgi:hypothetical protein